jgi:hypothetical protein
VCNDANLLRDALRRSDEKLSELSQEVSTIRSQLISSGYLTSSTGDSTEALSRALSVAQSVRQDPPLHRVTPVLGEPGLSMRSDRITLVSEADGRTALAQIERAAITSPILWKVSTPPGIGVAVSRVVEGWAEAMTAAVELAALTREYLDVAAQTRDKTNRLQDWQHGTLAQTSSTG